MEETIPVSVKLTKKELEEFDRVIKRSRKFLNRSDAIRTLIRGFIEKNSQEVTTNA